MAKKFDLEAYTQCLNNGIPYKNQNEGIIYSIFNMETGKRYIGRTKRALNLRIYEHLSSSFNKNSRSMIKSAFKKYGRDSFIIDVLEYPKLKDIAEREAYYIEQFNTLCPNGYNYIKHSDYSEISDTTRRRMSGSAKKRTPWNKGKKGYQTAWNKNTFNGKWSKPLVVVNINTKIAKDYPSQAEAVRCLNLNSGHVTQCCKGKLEQHKGYKFYYREDYYGKEIQLK